MSFDCLKWRFIIFRLCISKFSRGGKPPDPGSRVLAPPTALGPLSLTAHYGPEWRTWMRRILRCNRDQLRTMQLQGLWWEWGSRPRESSAVLCSMSCLTLKTLVLCSALPAESYLTLKTLCRPQCNMAVYYCFSAPPQVMNIFPEVSFKFFGLFCLPTCLFVRLSLSDIFD